MGRGIAIVLAISLGLNFLMSGFILHDVIRPTPLPVAGEFHGADHPRRLIGAARALAPDKRRTFRAAFRERLPNMRDQHRDLHMLREELRVLLEADDWDGEAVAAKMDQISSLRGGQRQAFNRAFIDAVEALSTEDRRRMFEAAAKMHTDHHKKRRGRRRPPSQE